MIKACKVNKKSLKALFLTQLMVCSRPEAARALSEQMRL
jgi:hypothetical protein